MACSRLSSAKLTLDVRMSRAWEGCLKKYLSGERSIFLNQSRFDNVDFTACKGQLNIRTMTGPWTPA